MPRPSLKQRGDKRFRAWYNGKQFYGSTQKEARQKRDEYKKQVEAGINITDITAGDYCLQWLETYSSGVTAATKEARKRHLKRFCALQPGDIQLGRKPLRSISTSEVQAFYNSLSGLSFSSVRQYTGTVRALFRAAVADRIILYDPTLKAAVPKAKRGTHRAIEQWERELIHTVQHRARLAALVMLYAGLRRGEALAIDIDRDVDFERKVIRVHSAIRFIGQHLPEAVQPKTAAGTREVPLLGVLERELKGHHGLLLPSASGGTMTESAWKRCWESYMVALSEAHNGGGRRWHRGVWEPVEIQAHDLRHTYCTMLYDAGVDIKTAQAWMGHADLQVTMKIYTHLSEQRKKAASQALESAAEKLSTVQKTVQTTAPAAQSGTE